MGRIFDGVAVDRARRLGSEFVDAAGLQRAFRADVFIVSAGCVNTLVIDIQGV